MAKEKKKSLLLYAAVSAAVLAAGLGAWFFFNAPAKLKKANLPPLRTGIASENFIMGYKEARTYTIHDFTGSYDIVMVFLGQSAGSLLLEKSLEQKKLPGKKTMLITLKNEESSLTVNEPYGHTGLKYRFHTASLPPMYKGLKDPGVIILDRSGSVRYIYSGYSPTIMSDLSAALSGSLK